LPAVAFLNDFNVPVDLPLFGNLRPYLLGKCPLAMSFTSFRSRHRLAAVYLLRLRLELIRDTPCHEFRWLLGSLTVCRPFAHTTFNILSHMVSL
jgi:hypothetical protein